MNHEIMTWSEVRHVTDWATQVPCINIFTHEETEAKGYMEQTEYTNG